jgi:UDP-2,4-diacetamido-2,4,6-trideoxy-beta-L-altropyranose hydrolase
MTDKVAFPIEGKSLLIRADAGPGIGAGHVMRCLALAQAWAEGGGKAAFIMAGGLEAMGPVLAKEGLRAVAIAAAPGSREDAAATLGQARAMGADWILLDGYRFGGDFQAALSGREARLMVIDDNGECSPYLADLVLNQNAHAEEKLHRERKPSTALLLGPGYALLRRQFRHGAGSERIHRERAERTLITMGGGDPDNVTFKAMEALNLAGGGGRGIRGLAVIGGLNPHYAGLRAAAEAPGRGIELRRDEPDMPSAMAWAEAAIAAAGSTTWELLFMGVPTLSISIAENQNRIARKLGEQGFVINLGWHAQASPDSIAGALGPLLADQARREEMSARGRALVDGKGVHRVIDAMLSHGAR